MHKYFLWLILTCCAITKGWGQYNEIGVFFGGVNPIADIGSYSTSAMSASSSLYVPISSGLTSGIATVEPPPMPAVIGTLLSRIAWSRWEQVWSMIFCISIPMSLLSFFLPLMYIQASIISRWIGYILTILPPLVSTPSIRPTQSVMNHGQYLLPWVSRLAYGDPAS